VLIVIASLTILREAYLGVSAPRSFMAPTEGLLINGAATVINALWSFLLIRVGRRRRSLVLVADGKHLLTDVLTSAGVIVGLGLAVLTGWALLGPLLAAVGAVNILWA